MLRGVVVKVNEITGMAQVQVESGRKFYLFQGRGKTDFRYGLDLGDVVQIRLTDQSVITEYGRTGRALFIKDADHGQAIGGDKFSTLLWKALADSEQKAAGQKAYKMVIE